MSLLTEIPQTMLELGRIQAQGIRDAAAARAQGQAASGQIWGQTIQQLGQIPGQVAQGMAQQKEQALKQQQMALQTQAQQMQVDAVKRAQAGEQQANQVIAALPRNPDGTYDTGALMQSLAQRNVPLDAQEKLSKSIDGVNGVLTSWNKSKADHAADLADVILKQHPAGEPVTAESVHLGVAAAKAAGIATDADEQKFTQALASGAEPEQILKIIRSQGSKFATEKPVVVPEGGTLVQPDTGAIVAAGQPKGKTQAELAADAANPESKTAGQSAAALALLKPPKTAADTAAEMDAKAQALFTKQASGQALTPDETAQLKGYVERKTVGPEASSAAAADRQVRTIAAQIAQQARAQGFTEGQAGRHEYAEKVAIPYQTALASAQTLRDTVAAAQSGNKVAANLQNLETAMAAIRAQGLNRINTTEIHVAADAGNLWDRVQSAFGKVSTGQSVDASLQKDMLQFADILEKSATLKYQKGRDSLNKVYPGSQLPDESVGAPASAAPQKATANLNTLTIMSPDGRSFTAKSRSDFEAAKRKLGIP